MRRVILALGLLSAGCQHAGTPATPEPQSKTTVEVENQNFLDMKVYVLRQGQRISLGTVAGQTTQVLTLPADIVRSATQLQFEIHPIGSRGNPRTETISVLPGDQVRLIIPPVL